MYSTQRKKNGIHLVQPPYLIHKEIEAQWCEICLWSHPIIATILFHGLCPIGFLWEVYEGDVLSYPEESEAQKEEILCLKLYSCLVAQLDFQSTDGLADVFRVSTSHPIFPPPYCYWISIGPGSSLSLTLLVLIVMLAGCR